MDQPTYPDPFRRNMITIFVMIGSFMSQLDVTIANVALPYMQGATSASAEQITWVLTSYIVTSAIFIPLSGWVATRYGRKNLIVASIGGFTLASLLCGMATSLPQIIAFRILQGVAGAAMMPMSQAVLLDINPPERHGPAMAIWGSGTVLGPIMGPLAGGWLTDNLSWRWVFLINVPFGLIAVTGLVIFMRNRRQGEDRPLDLMGFALLAAAVACFQLVLDRGQLLDWYNSTEIVLETGAGVTSLFLFLVHCLTARNPFLKLSMFRDRNYLLGSVLGMFVASLIYSVMALLPPMLNGLMGYDAEQVGMVMAPRGIGALTAMLCAGQLVSRMDSRLIVMTGLVLCFGSMTILSGVSLQMDSHVIIASGILQGLGSGLMFVPLSTMVFATLAQSLRNEGAALNALIRNLGGAMGISILQFATIRNAQKLHSYLAEGVRPDNPVAGWRMPDFDPEIAEQVSTIGREISRQAMMMSYVESIHVMVWICVGAAPLILLLRVKR